MVFMLVHTFLGAFDEGESREAQAAAWCVMKGEGGPKGGACQADTTAAPPGDGGGVPISRNSACLDGDLDFSQ